MCATSPMYVCFSIFLFMLILSIPRPGVNEAFSFLNPCRTQEQVKRPNPNDLVRHLFVSDKTDPAPRRDHTNP